MSLFGSKETDTRYDLEAVEGVLSAVRSYNDMNPGGAFTAEVAKKVLSVESAQMSVSDQQAVASGAASLRQALSSAVQGFYAQDAFQSEKFGKMTQTCSLEAAVIGATLATNARAAMVATQAFAKMKDYGGVEIVRPQAAGQDFYSQYALDMQAFDNTNLRSNMEVMTSFSLGAVRQSAFAQAFWTPVVVSPNEPGLFATMRARYVLENVTHKPDGSRTIFGKKPLVHALVDYRILRDDETDVIPVLRDAGTFVNTDKFVDVAVAAPTNIMFHGEPVQTSFLKFNTDVNLIGLSSIDALIEKGLFTKHDALDSSLTITEVLLKVGADVVKFDVRNATGATLTANPVEHHRSMTTQMLLTNEGSGLRINSLTKQYNGTDLVDLKAVVDNNLKVRFGFRLSANFNTEMGNGSVDFAAGSLKVAEILDEDGLSLDLTAAPAAAIVTALEGATALGYKVEARRINTNKRQRGQFVDTQEFRKYFAVPLRAPITAVRPVGVSDQEDAELIETLLETTYVRANNDAVSSLFRTFNALKEVASDPQAIIDVNGDFMGFASKLVNTVAYEVTLDMTKIVDSLTSTARTVDIQSALVNTLRDMAFSTLIQSNYLVALSSQYGGQTRKPTVVFGTDPRIAAYLNIPGETRLMGPEMEHLVVHTVDARMRNTIFMTFGDYSEESAGKFNPMQFGHFLVKPEVTTNLQISRGDETLREMTTQPSYHHLANLPVLVKVNVTNLEAVLAKNPIATIDAVVPPYTVGYLTPQAPATAPGP